MKRIISLSLFTLLLFTACQESASDKVKNSVLKLEKPKSSTTVGQSFKVQITDELKIDSVRVSGANFTAFDASSKQLTLHFPTVGSKSVEVLAYSAQGDKKATFSMKAYPKTNPKALEYEVLEVLEHSTSSYTQGLEVYNGFLYESTGQYGFSRARKMRLKEDRMLREVPLPPKYFGEGLTILRDTVYQFTWKNRRCYVYDPDVKYIDIRTMPTYEGWGLCNDGKDLITSDGSHSLYTLSSDMELKSRLEVYSGKKALTNLNELEYVDGKIYANIYNSDNIFIINPKTGEAEAYIDFSKLRSQLTHSRAEVLNGIAYLAEEDAFMITGKYWDKMFVVKIL
jgi:glutamine cyclotransferase